MDSSPHNIIFAVLLVSLCVHSTISLVSYENKDGIERRSQLYHVAYPPRNGSLCFRDNRTLVYTTKDGGSGECNCDIKREIILIFPLSLRKWNCTEGFPIIGTTTKRPSLVNFPPHSDSAHSTPSTTTEAPVLEIVHPGFIKWSDIILPVSYFENSTNPSIPSIPPETFSTLLWPQGIIPYTIEKRLSSSLSMITQAMESFHEKTCVKFIPRKNESNYMKIVPGKGCHSLLGMQDTGPQELSLGIGCQVPGIILHQLGHAIGLYHEHNRADRDKYIKVEWDEIEPEKRIFFSKWDEEIEQQPRKSKNDSRSFDYGSIMLFGPTVYAKHGDAGKTMNIRRGQNLYELQEKTDLSPGDVELINSLYNC